MTKDYQAIKGNYVLMHITTWLNLDNIVTGRSQSQRPIEYDSTYIKCPDRHKSNYPLPMASRENEE